MKAQKRKKLGVAVGVALRRLRDKAGLTQEELAFRFDVHRTYISMLERGRRIPSLVTLISLAEFLGASPVELMSHVERELKKQD